MKKLVKRSIVNMAYETREKKEVMPYDIQTTCLPGTLY